MVRSTGCRYIPFFLITGGTGGCWVLATAKFPFKATSYMYLNTLDSPMWRVVVTPRTIPGMLSQVLYM